MSALCRTCKAPVEWARTKTGRAIPLDLEPRADGNMVLANGLALHVSDAPASALANPRRTSHFATCPQAAEHRRPR